MMFIDTKQIDYEIVEITREDLALQLEEEAKKIRNNETKSLSVSIVAKDKEDSVTLTSMFVGTNPHRKNPEDGMKGTVVVKGIEPERLEEVYSDYLSSIDLNYCYDKYTGKTIIGFGYPDAETTYVTFAAEDVVEEGVNNG